MSCSTNEYSTLNDYTNAMSCTNCSQPMSILDSEFCINQTCYDYYTNSVGCDGNHTAIGHCTGEVLNINGTCEAD